MKVYRGVKAQSHSFLTSSLDRGECSNSLSGRFTAEKRTPVPIQQGDEGGLVAVVAFVEYVNKSGNPCREGQNLRNFTCVG